MVTEADLDRLREEFYGALDAQTEALWEAVTHIARVELTEETGEVFTPIWEE